MGPAGSPLLVRLQPRPLTVMTSRPSRLALKATTSRTRRTCPVAWRSLGWWEEPRKVGRGVLKKAEDVGENSDPESWCISGRAPWLPAKPVHFLSGSPLFPQQLYPADLILLGKNCHLRSLLQSQLTVTPELRSMG